MRDVSTSFDMTNKKNAKRLLLFDIDSTLVNTGGAGFKALQRVIKNRYGAADELDDIEIAGKTDRNIAADILEKYGVAPTTENVSALLDEYVDLVARLLPQLNGCVLPGIYEILTRMKAKPDRVLGLLTGNIERGAKLKLQRYQLWDFFEFGAFADDHQDRNQLGKFARARAQETHGHEFDAAQIDVIGDTGHDIACGKAFGARTVAVATGSWPRQKLSAFEPDFLFDDLSNVDEVIRTLSW
jgi:phosphoglycolate phosphatase-like HAD superfamily hydrolase